MISSLQGKTVYNWIAIRRKKRSTYLLDERTNIPSESRIFKEITLIKKCLKKRKFGFCIKVYFVRCCRSMKHRIIANYVIEPKLIWMLLWWDVWWALMSVRQKKSFIMLKPCFRFYEQFWSFGVQSTFSDE